MKNDLTRLPNISRIIFKRAGMTFMVVQPEVYFNNRRNCYVIFGDFQPMNFPGMGDVDAAPSSSSASTAASTASDNKDSKKKDATSTAAKAVTDKKGENKESQDGSSGLLESDIETVMREANVERERAIALLKEHGDTVEAILAASE